MSRVFVRSRRAQRASGLDSHGRLQVDVLKVPHHGSGQNTSRSVFRTVQADKYVISANGRDGHPSLATLIWIVETASKHKLLQEYPAERYGYRFTLMDQGVHSMTLRLAL